METARDLASFTKMAEQNPEEAFRFFKSDEFRKILPEDDHRARALWRGLVLAPASYEGMEEFLVGMNLKDIVEVDADDREASFYCLTDTVEETVTLRRIGRGSFRFRAVSDSDFIVFPRAEVTDGDFVGGTCDFAYRIDISRLGSGVRRGEIRFESPCRSFSFRVTASRLAPDSKEGRAGVDRNLLLLTKVRLNYMLGRCTRAEYIEESLRRIEAHYCSSTESLTTLRLYQAYLEKLKGNEEEASAILREFRASDLKEEESVSELACLYLKGLLGEPSPRLPVRVRSRFDRDGSSYLVLKLLYLTNPDIGRYPRRRKKAAEQVFGRGLRSPLLYAEVIKDLRQNDSLLISLDELTVQTLLFAAKQGLMTEGLALRCAYLSANEKFFSEPLLRILTSSFEKWQYDGILEAIVRLLMKGQPRDYACFPWYALAVERGIKVIRLYEYYIEAMPDSMREVLPLPLRKYFLYNNTLSREGRARVYANIVRNRLADPETYAAYCPAAEAFAYEALGDGCIGGDYAVLYQEFIRVVRDQGAAGTLSKLLFTSRLYCEDREVRQVVVVHDGLKKVRTVPLIRGTAYIPDYTGDSAILFENAASERFFTREEYSVEPLSESDELMSLLRAHEVPDEGFLLHELRSIEGHPAGTAREFELWRLASKSEECTPALRSMARRAVLQFILKNPESNFLSRGTPKEELALYAEADRSSLVQVLLGEGCYEEAYGVLCGKDIEGMPPDQLVRLAGRIIEERGGKKDKDLLEFSSRVYRLGKYDERMLRYLSDHFRGEMDEMLSIRRHAREFYIDTFALDDRILALAVSKRMNIEEGPEILKSYERHGGRRKLMRDYLEFYADAVLYRDVRVAKPAAECISRIYDEEEPMDFAMKLVLLRYYSEKPGLSTHEEIQVDLLMEECMKRNLRFAFMQKLPDSFVRQYRLDDRVFVEMKADIDAEVLITHTLKGGPEEGGESKVTEPLIHRFRGIFSREYTLFYGEELHYFLTVRKGGESKVTEERTLTAPPSSLSGTGSFQRIGRMLKYSKDGDEDALLEEMRSYCKAKQTAERLFVIEEF